LTTSNPSVSISGSIAFDYIMAFGGSFEDHIIPEKAHVISLSFLVDSLRKQRGGVGGNIAYSLALLGSSSYLVGAVGADFGPYRERFVELGIDLSNVIETAEELTASAFMMADRRDNQIASFFPGPAGLASSIDVTQLGDQTVYSIVGPTDPEAMRRHVRQFGASSSRLIFDPAFQIIILSAEDLIEGVDVAWAVVGNDYEFAMIEKKTGLTVEDIESRVELLAITYGDQGSELRHNGQKIVAPPAKASKVMDPTGAGDAYRSGLIRGLLLDQPLEIVGRIANLAAVYAVELVGTQGHFYTLDEFVNRFDQAFPDYAGSLTASQFGEGAVPSSSTAERSSPERLEVPTR
jgi:adenosine kinase